MSDVFSLVTTSLPAAKWGFIGAQLAAAWGCIGPYICSNLRRFSRLAFYFSYTPCVCVCVYVHVAPQGGQFPDFLIQGRTMGVDEGHSEVLWDEAGCPLPFS